MLPYHQASPDPCAACNCIPPQHEMWQQAPQQRVGRRLGALSGMHPDDDHHRTAPPHLSFQTRGRYPQTPCRDCHWDYPRSEGSPTPVSHRAAPTSGPSSRTESAHSSHLHGSNHMTITILMYRQASPDPGAALHGTPTEHRMWQQAQQQRVQRHLGALSGTQTRPSSHRPSSPPEDPPNT